MPQQLATISGLLRSYLSSVPQLSVPQSYTSLPAQMLSPSCYITLPLEARKALSSEPSQGHPPCPYLILAYPVLIPAMSILW